MFDQTTEGTQAWSAHEGIVGMANWREAHHQLQRIARHRAALDVDEARWLVIARRERVHAELGFATFLEYMERVLGYRRRAAYERLRVAEALEELPETRAMLAAGDISYSAVREITRVADADTEAAWLDAVAGKAIREVEDLVAGHAAGDLPTDPPDPSLELRRWSADLEPDVFAAMLDARRVIEETLGRCLDDSEFVAALCEWAVATPPRAGNPADGDAPPADRTTTRPPYQIALTICERCNAATQDAGGRIIDVAPSVVERAMCDADHVGRIDADVPGRATSEIPHATRRQVFRRDRNRCRVPGCRAAKHLAIHHIVPRVRGGDHALGNLMLICGSHHRAHHAGKLRIRGVAPDRLTFEHVDGSRYGRVTHSATTWRRRTAMRGTAPAEADGGNTPSADPFADARSALVAMGWTHSVATVAVQRACAHVGTDASVERIVAAALCECPLPRAG